MTPNPVHDHLARLERAVAVMEAQRTKNPHALITAAECLLAVADEWIKRRDDDDRAA